MSRAGFFAGAFSVAGGIAAAAALTAPAWLAVIDPPPPRAPAPGEGSDVVEIRVDGASPVLTDFTDPATGCTYLVHRLGGVTPRLDGVGKPMCRGVR